MFSSVLKNKAGKLLALCKEKKLLLASAESCTGGLIAGLLTEISGSSTVFERGFVSYSNEAKVQMLGVSAALIKKKGAVSAEVAKAMAEGALKNSKAHMAVAVTGIAGPGGGTQAKPVGLIYIAVALKRQKTDVQKFNFKGTRTAIRMRTVAQAIAMLTVSSDRFF